MSWPRHRLELLASNESYSFVGGPFGSKLTSRDYIDDGIPVIRGSNLNNGRYLSMEGFVFVSESKVHKDLSTNLAKPHDLIFTQRGTLGQVAVIPEGGISERYVVSQSQMKLTIDERKADRLFLYYYFSSRDAVERILSFTSSSGVPHINLSVLRSLEVPVPPLTTQRGIADILAAYDDLIENNQRRMALLEESARLLYQEWFVRLRFPGHEHTGIINGVPEGWQQGTIKEVTSLLSRGIAPLYNDDSEGLVINQKCIRGGRLDLSFARHQSREFKPDLQVQAGDVLVNSTGEGTLGRVAQVLTSVANCTVDTHVTIARPAATINPYYFGRALKEWEPRLKTMGRGATNQTELSRNQIGDVNIILPSEPLVRQFEEFTEPVSRKVANLMEQNQQLRTARDLLLPKLMSGEIAV